MKDRIGFLAAPDLADHAEWQRLCEHGRIQEVAGSEILKAYDYWRGDRLLAFKMRSEISRKVAILLRFKIPRSEKGQKAIFDDAMNVVAGAVEEPTGKRGLSLRKNFYHFVRHRADDALERAGVIPHCRREAEKARAAGTATVHVEYIENDPMTVASPEDAMLELLDFKRAMHKLDGRAKAAANMHYIGGDSLDDIAKVMKTTRHEVTKMLEPLRSAKGGRRT